LAFRAEQDQTMRGELSPLSRIDYVHLPAGVHKLAPDTPLFHVPVDAILPYRGDLRLRVDAQGLSLSAAPPVPRNGVPLAETLLANGDVLLVGRLRFLIAGLPGDPGVAIYDPEAPERRAYTSLHYYADDPRCVTEGYLERYPQPRIVRVAASRGQDKEQVAVGMLRFNLLGHSAAIEAFAERAGSDHLFLIFKDETNGKAKESYGGGRYLYATARPDGTVLLDFNQAWNPLCAYSPYFHCPIPPQKNWLNFPVPAGEKAYHEGH